MTNFTQSFGRLVYGPGLKASVLIRRDFANYYRSLLPKDKYINTQRYTTHITVVRLGVEVPTNMKLWGAYEGELICFDYIPIVREDEKYYWIDAYCERLGIIRRELGLPKYRKGYSSYHITIGNKKKEHEIYSRPDW